jgi:hypothetical protein
MSIRRFIRAVGVGVAIFAKRRPVFTLFVAVFVVLYGGFALLDFIGRLRETPQQTQARETAERQWAAAAAVADAKADAQRRAARDRDQLLCKVKSICAQYEQVRQDCATAGNFTNCIRVKMGDENYELVGSCTDDGHAIGLAEPGAVDCFFSRFPKP